jgi:hypothetical protein
MATIGEALAAQWERGWLMLADALGRFPDDQWRAEPGAEIAPARSALHLVETVDFYRGETPEYAWGARFGTDWEGSAVGGLPSAADITTWAEEIRAAVDARLRAMSDEEFLAAPNAFYWTGSSRLEHWLYSLRHLQHHLGELHGQLRARGLELEDWH